MADTIRVLGQLAAAATTQETLYTVPNLAVTTTSSLIVCNRTGAGVDFRIAIRVNGEALADKQYIYYDKTVATKDSHVAVLGMTLNQGDQVEVYASATGLSFTLFGVETSN